MPTIDYTTQNFFDATKNYNRRVGRYTGPASYVTGGDAFAPADVKLGRIDLLIAEPAHNGTVIIILRYSVETAKMLAFDLAGNEIANGTNLSAYRARFEAIGI